MAARTTRKTAELKVEDVKVGMDYSAVREALKSASGVVGTALERAGTLASAVMVVCAENNDYQLAQELVRDMRALKFKTAFFKWLAAAAAKDTKVCVKADKLIDGVNHAIYAKEGEIKFNLEILKTGFHEWKSAKKEKVYDWDSFEAALLRTVRAHKDTLPERVKLSIQKLITDEKLRLASLEEDKQAE